MVKKYENSETKRVWWYWSFTKHGAHALAKIMQDKFECKILSVPKQNNHGWEFSFTNPFKGAC